jgi:uncharacterized protein YwgA
MPRASPEDSQEIASALAAISRHTRRPFQMRTHGGRFRIQKTVYLLRRLGYPPAGRYSYSLYLNGPYSPDLATDYYALGSDGLARAPVARNLTPKVMETVLDALALGDEFLEGLCTALNVASDSDPFGNAVERARQIKPHIQFETWRQVASFVGAHPRLIPPT